MEGQTKTIMLGILVCLVAFCSYELEAKVLRSTEKELENGSPEEDFSAIEQCKCENGFCEKNSMGILECKCFPEWGLHPDGDKCIKQCKCENGFCEMNSSICNSCFPEWGLDRFRDKCIKCNCGKDISCDFGFFGTKRCLCDKGYTDKGGVCVECNCGKDFSCEFNFVGNKRCLCDKGYTEKSGVCVEISTTTEIVPTSPDVFDASTTYPPLSTSKRFRSTREPKPLTTGIPTEKQTVTALSSTASSTETTPITTTSSTLELWKSFVIKILIYNDKSNDGTRWLKLP